MRTGVNEEILIEDDVDNYAVFLVARDGVGVVKKEHAIEIVDHLNKVFGLIDVEVQAGFDEVMPEPDLSFLDLKK